MSKKEKRIAAQLLKAQQADEKKAVAVAKILGTDKTPIAVEKNEAKKEASENVSKSIYQKLVLISAEKADRKGSWSWGVNRQWHPEPGDQHIEDFTKNYHQQKSWREIVEEKTTGRGEVVKKKHVYYPLTAIVKEARDRLKELNLDDSDQIFRFRMTNKERLYGLVVGATFLIVWFDPTHAICPSGD